MKKMIRPRRSVLYLPAANEKALAKAPSLDADAIILDLEDAVAPAAKPQARERLRGWFAGNPQTRFERIIRINSLHSEWGMEDLLAARACNPDAILLPKVETPRDILDVTHALEEADAADHIRIWAMIETPRGILNADEIAELGRRETGRLDCFVIGPNDIARETGVTPGANRQFLMPWLMQILLCGKAGRLDVLDGVYNDFRNEEGFAAECAQGAAMGFDGKTLVHPSQIAPANRHFAPDSEKLVEARAIAAAFREPENADKGVISLNGRMVERLHLDMAEKLIAKAEAAGL
ncbi:MAG: HpcH/HpaI aldolase/citrate lyase family protein [Phyllobacterium sp.]